MPEYDTTGSRYIVLLPAYILSLSVIFPCVVPALVDMYLATGERKRLEQLVLYAEAMFANLTPNLDGFLTWRWRCYLRFRLQVSAAESNRSDATLEPGRPWLPP